MHLIDADNLKDELFNADWLTDNDEHMVEEIVERQKTVDAEPVRHGRWIERDNKTWCSECEKSNKAYKPPYCPHCGAKMGGGAER